jgi:hypothetical protein
VRLPQDQGQARPCVPFRDTIAGSASRAAASPSFFFFFQLFWQCIPQHYATEATMRISQLA